MLLMLLRNGLLEPCQGEEEGESRGGKGGRGKEEREIGTSKEGGGK
jgi:hypothetical protein